MVVGDSPLLMSEELMKSHEKTDRFLFGGRCLRRGTPRGLISPLPIRPLPHDLCHGWDSPCWLPALSHVQHFCSPLDCSPPGSSVLWIFQAWILEWIPRGSSWPISCVSCIARQFVLPLCHLGSPNAIHRLFLSVYNMTHNYSDFWWLKMCKT